MVAMVAAILQLVEGRRTDSGERASIVTLCIRFLTCFFSPG
jgi:hypothetical protein